MADSIDIRRLGKNTVRPSGPSSLSSGPSDGAAGKERSPSGGFWSFLNKDIQVFGDGLPDKVKEAFYHELSVLLGAGVNLRGALDLIKEEQHKAKHRLVFEQVENEIVGGATLSLAMRQNGKFTPYEYYSVQIGEETGKLLVVLTELSGYYKKKIEQQRQLIGALTYPVLVLTIAVMAIAFMLTYVVPMFADVLKRFGGELPFMTRMVMRISGIVKQYSLIFFCLCLGVGVFVATQRKKTWFRKYSSSVVLRIPMVGDLVRKIYLSRFSNTMSLLIGSRIAMLQAIELVSRMVDFYPIESTLGDISAKILAGAALHETLGNHKIYPRKMVAMIKVGEEVNQLDTFFNKVSLQYSAEVEYQTTILSKFMEPLIIVVLGLVVGVILIAMYLPLFKLGQAV
jgi:type IV pilus assembly protein PilC